MHHPAGRAFAVAFSGRILVRTNAARATLAAEPVEDLPGWVAVDPFPGDVAFERGTNVLRDLLAARLRRRRALTWCLRSAVDQTVLAFALATQAGEW